MSGDDQYFLDILSSIPNDVRRYSSDVADSIDRHIDVVANAIRDTLSTTTWIPESAKPMIPRRVVSPPPPIHQSFYERAQDWMVRNKGLFIVLTATASATGFILFRRRRRYNRKRRARRAGNGARKEVVVVAGPPHEPILRSLYLDLERRGFIVYVVVNTPEGEHYVRGESRGDIRPLLVDVTDPVACGDAVERFNKFLQSPQHAFAGAHPHYLNLAGFLLIPDSLYPAGPVETLSPDIWSDALNAKIIAPIATTQAFLRTISEFKSRVLILTPSIIPSLTPPFHSIESSVVAALGAFTTTLTHELNTLAIDVSHLKLGAFDLAGISAKHQHQQNNQLQPMNGARADVLTWPETARAAYAKNYFALSESTPDPANARNSRGTHLRELHNTVFDALTLERRPRSVLHVGRGSLIYDVVGRWVPGGIVGWMLGIRRVDPTLLTPSPAFSSPSFSSSSSPTRMPGTTWHGGPAVDQEDSDAHGGVAASPSASLSGTATWEKVETDGR
ncbi:MAG: RNA-binding component of cleavage and polyadenylation factor [Chaenotheca gracillima]|nr:MAG: RNA-binding component of cleavage and polyadenylation factor [Chaenotheca gracillima]